MFWLVHTKLNWMKFHFKICDLDNIFWLRNISVMRNVSSVHVSIYRCDNELMFLALVCCLPFYISDKLAICSWQPVPTRYRKVIAVRDCIWRERHQINRSLKASCVRCCHFLDQFWPLKKLPFSPSEFQQTDLVLRSRLPHVSRSLPHLQFPLDKEHLLSPAYVLWSVYFLIAVSTQSVAHVCLVFRPPMPL